MKRNELRQRSGNALLLGVGSLGSTHYGTRTSCLHSPEIDTLDFERIAKLNGLEVKACLDSTATRQNFQINIAKAAKSLGAGDFFLLVFSGFGGQVPNFSGKGMTKSIGTWCLYDSQILVSEIKTALSTFQAGVNILVIEDCSNILENVHSSTEQKAMSKSLQKEIAATVYLTNKDFYDAATLATASSSAILANIVWLHACQPNQMSHENAFNGLLTSAIKQAWKGGLFSGNFQQFFEEVTYLLPPFQSPRLELMGGNPSELLAKRPFSI